MNPDKGYIRLRTDYDCVTSLEVLNLDEWRKEKIKSGKGFIISDPKGIKQDLKTQSGIYSSRYGTNNITDIDVFSGNYKCDCGRISGSMYHGEICPYCNTMVKQMGNDISISGFLVLKDKYWIIHPNMYSKIAAFIGDQRLNRIISPNVKIDSNGKVIKNLPPAKKDEPFREIGLIEFKERFDEIMDFYLSLFPGKQAFYDEIMKVHRDCVFTHTISVFSSLLRPAKVDNGSLKYEACNDYFSILSKLVYRCNKDKLKIDQKPKEKLQLLYDIQYQLMALDNEIREIMSHKKGDIRSAVGGRYAFTSRCVIRQDVTLRANQIKLPYSALCVLLQQVIVNILQRTYQCTYADAYKKWFKAQTVLDKVVYDIIDGLIKDSGEGLPLLINRNPTISFGGILSVKCIGINDFDDKTMSISLLDLKLMAADFDGDTLNILYLYNKDFIKEADMTINPNMMYIDKNTGLTNMDMIFGRDVLINANAMRQICSDYTPEQMDKIKMLQSVE